MDLTALGKRALLIPTPNQNEQEYLAKYHSKKGSFIIQNQKSMNLKEGIQQLGSEESMDARSVQSTKKGNSHSLLKSTINNFLDSIA